MNGWMEYVDVAAMRYAKRHPHVSPSVAKILVQEVVILLIEAQDEEEQ